MRLCGVWGLPSSLTKPCSEICGTSMMTRRVVHHRLHQIRMANRSSSPVNRPESGPEYVQGFKRCMVTRWSEKKSPLVLFRGSIL